MTFEELKEEAHRQGYNLVKKNQPIPKLLKCPICGRKPKVNYGWNYIYVDCPSTMCLIGPTVKLITSKNKTERLAREGWNEMVKDWLNVDEEEKS